MSFHPVKQITTGEGGAVVTNNFDLDKAVNLHRTHGIEKSNNKILGGTPPWHYEMVSLGFNYRLSDFQCALGMSQLKRIEQFLSRRRTIAKIYDESFVENQLLIIPPRDRDIEHAYHLYPLRVKFNEITINKRDA